MFFFIFSSIDLKLVLAIVVSDVKILFEVIPELISKINH